MDKLSKEIHLANGLKVKFLDKTYRYFGDFHHVKLEISCEMPIKAILFEDPAALSEAVRTFGECIVYRRLVEQMGVPSTETAMVLDRLMNNFLDHSLPYFATTSFPQKLIAAELNNIKKKMSKTSSILLHSND